MKLLLEKLLNAFPFKSSDVDVKELEKLIADAIKKSNPSDKIDDIKYTKDGVVVILDNGEEIDIDIDWNEIILS